MKKILKRHKLRASLVCLEANEMKHIFTSRQSMTCLGFFATTDASYQAATSVLWTSKIRVTWQEKHRAFEGPAEVTENQDLTLSPLTLTTHGCINSSISKITLSCLSDAVCKLQPNFIFQWQIQVVRRHFNRGKKLAAHLMQIASKSKTIQDYCPLVFWRRVKKISPPLLIPVSFLLFCVSLFLSLNKKTRLLAWASQESLK